MRLYSYLSTAYYHLGNAIPDIHYIISRVNLSAPTPKPTRTQKPHLQLSLRLLYFSRVFARFRCLLPWSELPAGLLSHINPHVIL